MTSSARPAAALVAVAAACAVVAAAPAVAVPTVRAATRVSAASADHRIATKLAGRVHASALGSDVALRVFDPATGATVYSHQGAVAQLPASNMKLVTALTSLTVLGPATRFPTTVMAGSKAGHVVLVGGGDPLLTATNLRTLAARTVSGLASRASTHQAPAHVTLALDDHLFVKPTRARGWTSSYGLGDISPVRALGVHGVASSDTSVAAERTFAAALAARGVRVTYTGRTATYTATRIAVLAGHRVDTDVHQMLRNSDNQVAETLFRQVALATERTATWSGGAAAARAVLEQDGVPLAHVALVDGSGLSRANRLTNAAVIMILRRATVSPPARLAVLVPSLPTSGRTGTLRGRFVTPASRCAVGLVHAKTGFVNGVVALSGVARGADGKPRLFSIIVNHAAAVTATQHAVDALAATITGCR